MAALLAGFLPCHAVAAISELKNLGQLSGPGPRIVTVYFSSAAGLAPTQLTDPNLWRVTVVYPAGTSLGSAPLTVSANPAPHLVGGDPGTVNLTVNGAVEASWHHVVVEFLGSPGGSLAQAAQADLVKTAAQRNQLLAAANGKSDADIYLSGLWMPVASGPTTYNIDTSIAFRLGPRISPHQWFYFTSSVNTNNEKKVDPDSFRWRTAWRYVSPQRYAPILDLGGGMEFDRTGNVINALASPRATWPFIGICSKFYLPLIAPCPDKPGTEIKPAFAYEFDLTLGTEVGGELKDPIHSEGRTFPGTGMVLRGAPQAKLLINFIKVPHIKQIIWENGYDARFLARPEIFLETRLGKPLPVPMITGHTRQRVVNAITFKFNDLLGGTFKHEFGSLPPAYTFIEHKFTIGLTLQLKQNRTLRY
jgi:hypothetical protein